MRIAFLPSSYLPETVGGTEVYVHELALALVRRGHEIAVVWHSAQAGPAGDGGAYESVRLPPLPEPSRVELYRREAGADPPGFAEFLDVWQPDLLHFHALTLGAGPGHARVARRRGVPYFVTYHTPTFSCPAGTVMYRGREACDGRVLPARCASCVLNVQGWPWPAAWLAGHAPLTWHLLPEGPLRTRFALASLLEEGRRSVQEFFLESAGIVACAMWCRDVLTANGVPGSKVVVHRQALPGSARLRQLRLPLGQDRPLRLGFLGRVSRSKGPDLLLQAAARLRQEGSPVECEIAGPVNESERAWWQRLTTRYTTGAYRGVLRGPDLVRWLDSLDLLVVPSRLLETGPLTLLDAWDRGVPVIGADLGGIREYLKAAGMDDLLFAPDDPGALAAAVRRAMMRPGPVPSVVIAGTDELAAKMEDVYASRKQTRRRETLRGTAP